MYQDPIWLLSRFIKLKHRYNHKVYICTTGYMFSVLYKLSDSRLRNKIFRCHSINRKHIMGNYIHNIRINSHKIRPLRNINI